MFHNDERVWRNWFFAVLTLASATLLAQDSPSGLYRINPKTPEGVKALFRYTAEPIPLVSAHRGGPQQRFPENCIATFENTLRQTYAMLEIDPRYTKDGAIVVHHDATLDRTTTGKGPLAQHSLTELKQFRLKDNDGNVTDYQIPTLDEVLEWARGKTVLVLDQKDVPVAARVKKIEEHRAESYAMLIVYNYADAKACYTLNKKIMMEVMVPNQKQFAEFSKTGVPWSNVVAFVGHALPEDKRLFELIHEQGTYCMAGSSRNLDRELITGKVATIEKLADGYRGMLQKGVDLIETDIPTHLGPLLNKTRPVPTSKAAYFVMDAAVRAVCGDEKTNDLPLVQFPPPWTSPYRVDTQQPYQLVNREGKHLFILNKTAWAYFGCDNPGGVLDRAASQGVNVLRVALEGSPYFEHLGIDLWPYGGTREKPAWQTFNTEYWDRVEQRVRLAGEKGIGLDIVINMQLHPQQDAIEQQRPYWEETLRRLSKYANVLTWEIANEYVKNEDFQDAAGKFFKANDARQRPVCTSDGTTDDAIWPDKPWVDLAINHTCTSSTARHDLRDWYLALARNTRGHGKPAFANETGREKRHRNDDGVHRRKQGWLWCAAGGFWTWHSWDGCEGINDLAYRAPGEEFLKPMATCFQALEFWRMDPNYTACVLDDANLVQATLATPDRRQVVAYFCTKPTGQSVSASKARLSLPEGEYQIRFLKPADGTIIETRRHNPKDTNEIELPAFQDDLAVIIDRTRTNVRKPLPGTQ